MSDPLTNDGEAPQPNDPKATARLAELQRLIGLGMDLEGFMRGPLGQYIQRRASQELEDAQEALMEAELQSTEGRAKARELQLQGRVAARVLTYFADIEREAQLAEQQHAIEFEAQRHTD